MTLVRKIFQRLSKTWPANQKGIALLLVLSSVMILTVSVVEFVYSTRIHYQVAVNAKERLQAYYLAKSALNFSRIILKYSKEAEKLQRDNADKLKGMKIEPLYRMMPLSSNMLRGVLSGALTDMLSGADSASDTEPSPDEKPAVEIKPEMGMLDKSEAEKFLDFDGDFLAEITEEATKYDLNSVYGVETSSTAYDLRKKLLFSILKLPRFKSLLEEQDAEKLTHALGDWADTNDVINEFEKIQRGSEDGIYSGVDYKVKSAKYLTLSEIHMVSGMTDAIYDALKPLVTVYSKSDKINVCLAEDEDMARAVIYFFTHYSACTSPVEYDDEAMTDLVSEVTSACPDAQAMGAAIESKLGIATASQPETPVESAPDSPQTEAKTQPGKSNNGCLMNFKDLVTADNKVFTVRATGTVGETQVTLVSVLTAEGASSSNWKQYYFRME